MPCRSAITFGGMHLLQSSLKMMPCWPLLSVWRMDPNATVRNLSQHFNPRPYSHKLTTCWIRFAPSHASPVFSLHFWSNWSDVDSKVLPEYIRGRCHRALLCAQTSQGVLPQQLCLPWLWSVHHGHPEWKAHVHTGVFLCHFVLPQCHTDITE